MVVNLISMWLGQAETKLSPYFNIVRYSVIYARTYDNTYAEWGYFSSALV